MSKKVILSKVIEKFDHFKDIHPENSICVHIDSTEKSIYVLGRRFPIKRGICVSVNDNGKIIPLDLGNLTIACKSRHTDDFVGYVYFKEEMCYKISAKYPYSYDHSFIFAFASDYIAAYIILTKPITEGASLSGMSFEFGIKNGEDKCRYNNVMEDLSAFLSIVKSTALRNVESDAAFVDMFISPPALPQE